MKCFKHQSRDAVGECSQCGKGVCTDCCEELEGKLVCKSCYTKRKTKEVQKMAEKKPQEQTTEKKSPIIALILSFVWSGLGQIYNGELGKGLALIVVYFISAMATMLLIGFCTTPLIWLYGMYDAYKTAEKINKGEKNV